MDIIKHLSLHLISDASGETVTAISQAISAQFESQIHIKEYLHPLVRSKQAIDDIICHIEPYSNSIILYTLIDLDMRMYIVQKAEESGIIAIFALEHVITQLAKFAKIEIKSNGIPGKNKKLDAEYYEKIENLNFAMQHDDGNEFRDADKADIVLLGVSRTSKSPTSLYLAQRGYKVANLPIIKGIDVNISTIKNPMMIGLTISAEILHHIRTNRLRSYNVKLNEHVDEYTEIDQIRFELTYANRIFRKYNIQVIDVSKKAIEEIAAEIINLYYIKKRMV